MDFSSLTLRSGLRLIAAIATHMAGDRSPVGNADRYHGSAARPPDPKALALIAQAELQRRRERTKYMPDHLFGEPSWDILLDLYVWQTRGKAVSITSACMASHVPPTTALRYVEVLCKEGLLIRRQDSADQRRRFVELSPLARRSVEAYLGSQMGSLDQTANWLLLEGSEEPLVTREKEFDGPTER